MSAKLTTLANGLRVVTHRMPGLETTSLGLWVASGARHESEDEHGISHLLEHMAFKGTRRRSARQIAEEIEAVGGEINAATGMEATAYYARVLKGDEGLALDILADILQNPLLEADELERERDVILQEIAASHDSPDDVVYDLVEAAAFPDQSLGRPILGTPESIGRLTSEDLSRYLAKHYRADRIVVAAAGALDHDVFTGQVEAQLGRLTAGPQPTAATAAYRGGILTDQQDYEQAHVILAFEGPSIVSPDYLTAQVLSGLLGGGMSSRLFQEVREARGLCYSIYSFASGFSDTGLIGIHAAAGPGDIPRLMDVVTAEILDVARNGARPGEVRRAKSMLKAGLMMSLESSGARAEQMARQVMIFGRTIGIAELAERVERVSEEDVQRLAMALMVGTPPSWSEVGPEAGRRSYDEAAARLGVTPQSLLH